MSLIVPGRHHKDGNGEWRNMSGHRQDRAIPDSHKRFMLVPPGVTFPSAFFFSPMTQVRVRNQGSLGCCVGETYAEIADAQRARVGKLTPETETSEEDAYKVARIEQGTPLDEDSGSSGQDMIDAASKSGVTTSILCPFGDTEDVYSAPRTPQQIADALQRKVDLDLVCPTPGSIKFSLMQGFGVMTGFTCYQGLMSPQAARTGEIPFPEQGESSIGGHEMGISGWNDDYVIGPYTGVWILRQHWAIGWGATFEGVQSYGLLPYAYGLQGLMGDNHSPRLIEMPS